MPFRNIKIIDPYVEKGWTPKIKLTLANTSEVSSLEKAINITVPVGYSDYVTALGLGDYCSYLRIYMPGKILSEYQENQRFLDEYWSWEMGKDILSKQKAIESIQIADTVDGDIIIFHPSNVAELFVLPRHDDMLHQIGSNLFEAINWLCVGRHDPKSGQVGETHNRRYFIPENPFVHSHGHIVPENID